MATKTAYVVIAFDDGAEYADEYEIIGVALNKAMADIIKEDFEAKKYGYTVEIRPYEIGKMYDFVNG